MSDAPASIVTRPFFGGVLILQVIAWPLPDHGPTFISEPLLNTGGLSIFSLGAHHPALSVRIDTHPEGTVNR